MKWPMQSSFIEMENFYLVWKSEVLKKSDCGFSFRLENLLVVPKLDTFTCKEQADVRARFMTGTLITKYKLCFGTRQPLIQVAYIELVYFLNKSKKEQFLLVLRIVFEIKIHPVTERPDIALFRNFNDNVHRFQKTC